MEGEPALYLPFESGRYTVGAGLFRLGAQPVHGRVEAHTFAFDREYGRFLKSKVAARTRGLHEGYLQAGLSPALRTAALTFALGRLGPDSGGAITWDGRQLSNSWLGWRLELDVARGTLEGLSRFDAPLAHLTMGVTPLDALDALALNVQEDFSLVARDPATGRDFLACLHVLNPQHWDPRDKIGRDFVTVHAPVAGNGPMNASAPKLLDAVIHKGPYLRFAWGVSMSDRLDHHPAAPASEDRAEATRFAPEHAHLRVERQTLTGFAAEGGALFTIRPYVYPLAEAVQSPDHRAQLAAALRSMTPEQAAYKGLSALMDDLLTWLDG